MGKIMYLDEITDTKKLVDEFESFNEKGKQTYTRLVLRHFMPLPALVPGAEQYSVSLLIKRGISLRWSPTFDDILDEAEDSPLREQLREVLTEDVVRELLEEKQYYFKYADSYKFKAQCSTDPKGEYPYGYMVMGAKLNMIGIPSWQERVGSKRKEIEE